MYDLIIIGSGPAGLSAAVYARRAKLDVLVLEKAPMSGGQILNSEQVDNYLGMNGLSGFDLAAKFRVHADCLKVSFETAEVTEVTRLPQGENSETSQEENSETSQGENSGTSQGENSGTSQGESNGTSQGESNGASQGENSGTSQGESNGTSQDEGRRSFMVKTADGRELETKAVLLAAGAGHKLLNVPGESRLTGYGVSYCATCDGAFYRNMDVAVIGGGDVALWDAVYLAKLCKKVYLVHRRDGFRAAKYIQDRVLSTENIEFLPFFEAEEIKGDQRVESLQIKNNQTGDKRVLAVSGVFVAVGMVPQTDLVKSLVETDKAGYVKASEEGITSLPGIFVAGDARTKALRQVATAVSDGANAAVSIEQYLCR